MRFLGVTVTPESDKYSPSTMTDWVFTALAIVSFFAYILVIGFAPEIFARPIVSGSLISVGIVSGIAVSVFLVALAGIYTHLRNRKRPQ
jgi:uncharacterized membrane protein (DUF485 family)